MCSVYSVHVMHTSIACILEELTFDLYREWESEGERERERERECVCVRERERERASE